MLWDSLRRLAWLTRPGTDYTGPYSGCSSRAPSPRSRSPPAREWPTSTFFTLRMCPSPAHGHSLRKERGMDLAPRYAAKYDLDLTRIGDEELVVMAKECHYQPAAHMLFERHRPWINVLIARRARQGR